MSAKILSVIAVSIFSFSLSAKAANDGSVASADYYHFAGWRGEYPMGFELLKEVQVSTVASPVNPVEGAKCTLKKNSVIHPWAEKTRSEFVTLSPLSLYVAKKDFQIGEGGGAKSTKVAAGETITELTYLSEGFCLYSFKGKEIENTCLQYVKEAKLKSVSPFKAREFFKTACADGKSRWVDAEHLQELVQSKSPSVKEAEVLDYGKVKEP